MSDRQVQVSVPPWWKTPQVVMGLLVLVSAVPFGVHSTYAIFAPHPLVATDCNLGPSSLTTMCLTAASNFFNWTLVPLMVTALVVTAVAAAFEVATKREQRRATTAAITDQLMKGAR